MNKLLMVLSAGALFGLLNLASPGANAAPPAASGKPTIVLVHGAFAESASWDGVITRLIKDGYPVIAAANPLRSVKGDAAHVSALVASIKGPVVLVGHSYAGIVITNAAVGRPNVKALVYVDAFQPEAGETGLGLTGKFPGSTLSAALAPPVPLPDGNQDLYIVQDKFQAQFAADVPHSLTEQMAATQRPITQAALAEPSGEPAWRTIPSWSIYGSADRNIPPALLAFMAKRANARHTVEVKGGSHVLMVAHPQAVTAIIEEAARSH
ncbi:MAG TPA: alpha/beta hydrolase [Rhizomicrobium sp.]